MSTCVLVIRWLLDKNVSVAEIDSILEKEDSDGVAPLDAEAMLAHNDQSTWLLDCDRRDAEMRLAGKEDGTFLIRPKLEEGDVYVLSIS